MSTAKYFFIGVVLVFGFIGIRGFINNKEAVSPLEMKEETNLQAISIPEASSMEKPKSIAVAPPLQTTAPSSTSLEKSADALSHVDRVALLFALDSSRLPFVETISYTSRVPWLKGRPAWISDYASHYQTSRHFIARSLNKKADYFSQKIGPGDKFNVFKKDKNIHFHLTIDLQKSKMRFYVIDLDTNERTLLKTYKVGLGRMDSDRKSGYLTPVGKYVLGEKIAIYKPNTMGFFQNKKTEMIRVFGTRWIPFDKELEGCSESAKGLGIHGAPWNVDPVTGQLVEDKTAIDRYESDGCIRLCQEDMEELFSIVITKPTVVEIVKDFSEAKIPGIEKGCVEK
jgi:lipoprotein-anchoring transpeptidase ErfK/SrfK